MPATSGHEPFEDLAAKLASALTDEEWAAREEAARRREEQASARHERQRQEALRFDLVEIGCPVKDVERALEGDMFETPSLAAARQALEERWTLVVLSGPPGIGKTSAAAWWLLQRHEAPRFIKACSPRFVTAPVLSRWQRFSAARMAELELAAALVIDDLGMEYADEKGALLSLLDGVINARYAAWLPTLITTNLLAGPFKNRYGERIADRIREAGRFVPLTGESLRSKAAVAPRAGQGEMDL